MTKPEPIRLKVSQVKAFRADLLEKQGGLCLLCGLPIEEGKAVLDHAHYKPNVGHIRAVLHRGCNAIEGKITNAKVMNRISDQQLQNIFHNYPGYTSKDYTDNDLYPKKSRKRRKKATA